MARIYPNTEVTETGTFRNTAGTLVDPTSVLFEYRNWWECQWTSVTPVKQSTGVYDATFTPLYPGMLYFRWQGTGLPKIQIEDTMYIERTAFSDRMPNTDYCGCW